MNKPIKNIFDKMHKKIFRGNNEIENIDLQTLNEMIKEGTTLIDVRSPQEYNENHIDTAILIPEYTIQRNIEQMVDDKEEKIILYCNSGQRSLKACKKLNKLGYTNLYNLDKGTENY